MKMYKNASAKQNLYLNILGYKGLITSLQQAHRQTGRPSEKNTYAKGGKFSCFLWD